MEIKIGNGVRISTPRVPVDILLLQKPAATERNVRTLAKALGMEPKVGTFASDPDKLTYTHQHFELTVFRNSGGFRWVDKSRWQMDDGKTNIKMEDSEAANMARAFALKSRLAPRGEFRFAKAARLHVATATKEGKRASDRVVDVAVALQRMIGKVPVDGPGGRIVVYLDSKGGVTGIEKIWRGAGKVFRKGGAFRTIDDVVREIAAYYRTKQGVLEIQEVRFAYFEEGWRAKQKYLQPAYIITAMGTFSDNRFRKRAVYVAPALINATGRITPLLEQKAPQEYR